MTSLSPRRRAATAVAVALAAATLVPGLTQPPTFAGTAAPRVADDVVTLGDSVPGLDDLDARGHVLPTATQRSAAGGLGAVDLRWNRFGTPSSILPADGILGAATSADPGNAARAWLRDHAAVFGLSPTQVDGLDEVSEQELAQSDARAVLFRQRFGDLPSALDGMVTVGVANDQIAYVSSSLARTDEVPEDATLSPVQGWLAAAANVGRDGIPAGDVDVVDAATGGGWARLSVPGFAQEQQVRLRALALADGTVRPVFEANVVDVTGGSAFAYTLMVDAVSGDVLHRQNQVDQNNNAVPFQGEITATDCGPKHPFELTDGNTKQITAVAAMANTADDAVVKIFDPSDQLLASGDLLTSPETATYSAASIPAGIYSMQVCPFDSPTVPFTPPGNYAALVTTSDTDQPAPDDATFPPHWRFFPSNPTLNWSASATPHNTVVGCWTNVSGCTLPTGPLVNVAAPGPWDTTASGDPTLTTIGNNANTHEAWASPDSPGGTAQAPVSATREYSAPFTDAWNNSRCDPTELHPTGNDIDQVVTNLFVAHNQMHDYAYYLGFTEANYNLQLDNLGRGGTDGDQEVGNAQAGALTGGQPTFLGRDNANQITLQDGTPGITNQYLFQPIAGAFYSPCVDGALDMSVVGHEYTHAISNRMIGGPDESITSEQGGAMGESWGDLNAAQYMYSHGYRTGANPWVVGPYATGNKRTGIRDYAIDHNPLNYSDYGYDVTGVEVHADGEIWNGTQWSVRQALVKKWNARYPTTDRALELACARATATSTPRSASRCPGDRRWIQLVFDAFLLQQGATSMLDARDAMLAADRMRFGGKDLTALWNAFASRGMGKGASTPNADSGQPKPSFASPRARNATVSFRTSSPGRIFVGRYEARVTPVADTVGKTKQDETVRLAPGRYQMLYVSRSRGFQRFDLRVGPGQHRTVRVGAPRNLAGAGARVLRASAGSLNAKYLIDGTEDTAWGGVSDSNVDATHPFVAVDLAGGMHRVRRIQVSAMLNPAPASPTDVPLAADPDSGSRFTALRKFAVDACVRHCSSANARWRRIFVSSNDAFPAVRPRPVAPNLTLRSFDVPDSRAAAIRLVALENQCTGYAGYAGEQDADPANTTDCKAGSDRGTIVHAAELQVF